MNGTNTETTRGTARIRLLEAARDTIRAQGYAATSVEDLCRAAGVTKGAFFHHFASKEALGVAAAGFWAETTGEMFAGAPYHEPADPLARVLAYVDFRSAMLGGETSEYTCLVGTMVQEAYDTHPAIRDACAAAILGHARTLEDDIAAAKRERGVAGAWSPASLALHIQGVPQGAFILAKATGEAAVAAESVAHLRRYIELLFAAPAASEGKS